jgi:hypothetical protein
MLLKKALTIAAVSAIASVGYASSASAVGLSYNAGSIRDAGVTNQGAFSNSVNDKKYTTLDFNDGKVPQHESVNYTFSDNNPSFQAYSGKTGIYADHWAPSGVNGEKNTSNYLAVFSNASVSIQQKDNKSFNYFGLDLGALSGGNTLQFFNGAKSVATFTYDMLNKMAPVAASQHGGQHNGFFEFFSEMTDGSDNFNKIVLSQDGGGGFESDNHTFRIGTGKYVKGATSVPEPGLILGLSAVGGMLIRKRKQHSEA